MTVERLEPRAFLAADFVAADLDADWWDTTWWDGSGSGEITWNDAWGGDSFWEDAGGQDEVGQDGGEESTPQSEEPIPDGTPVDENPTLPTDTAPNDSQPIAPTSVTVPVADETVIPAPGGTDGGGDEPVVPDAEDPTPVTVEPIVPTTDDELHGDDVPLAVPSLPVAPADEPMNESPSAVDETDGLPGSADGVSPTDPEDSAATPAATIDPVRPVANTVPFERGGGETPSAPVPLTTAFAPAAPAPRGPSGSAGRSFATWGGWGGSSGSGDVGESGFLSDGPQGRRRRPMPRPGG